MELEELGRYQISGKLGEGAMGVVYRAFDPLLERVVAIKTIKFDCLPSEEEDFERRFFREAKSAARLNHPNIVTVYDAGKSGNISYIAMELLEGRDLRQLMINKPALPIERVIEIIVAVADGLAYAHENGVVHRDIKPANIMVLDNGGIKIADFGVAQMQTGTKTMIGMIVGTSKYMSPEHIMGLPVDGRTDIFSLGVILYQLLTGVPPFEGDTVTTIMYRVIHEAAVRPSHIAKDLSAGFDHILAKALAKNPDDRYQTATAFVADLRNQIAPASQGPLPWTGVSEQSPPAVSGRPPGNAEDTAKDKTPIIPPALTSLSVNSSNVESTSTVAVSTPPVEPTVHAIPLPDGVARHESKLPVGSDSRLIIASIAILLLIGSGVFFFTTDGTPGYQETHPATTKFESTPVKGTLTEPADLPVATKVESAPVNEAAPTEPPTPPDAVGSATLMLAISPWGEIYVDGKSAGVSPPLLSLAVPAGKRQIEIRNEGAKSYAMEVDLKKGEVKRLKYKF